MAPRKLTEQEKREKAALKERLQRSDPVKRRREQTKDAAARRQSRGSSAVRRLEQKRDTTARRIKRADTTKRKTEQSKDTEAHRVTRSDIVKRKAEQSRNTEAHRVTRSDTVKRKAEQSRNTEAHRVTRSDTVKRKLEQSRNTEAHRATISDTAKRKAEQSKDTEAHRVTRSDTAKRMAEQSRDTEAHRAKRSVPIYKKAEQRVNTLQKRAKRTNAKNRLVVESDFSKPSKKFKQKIQDGPTHVCSCCGRLWYRTSITKVTKDRILNQGVSEDTVGKILFVNASQHGLCNTCWKHVKSGKLPKLALANGFGLPSQPDELKDMTPLEERLVALRIPFAQIRAKGLERQSALFGNIVNVECYLTECAKVLPRQFNELSVVQVMFKRRLSYKHPVWNERIRPYKVYKAAQYLIKTPGYLKLEVVLSDQWKRHQDVDSMDFIVENDEDLTEEDPNEQDGLEEFHHPNPDNRVNLGAEETLIYDNSQLKCISIAPGENKIPVPLNRDLRAEELSFPCTWCGQERVFNENLKNNADRCKEIGHYAI